MNINSSTGFFMMLARPLTSTADWAKIFICCIFSLALIEFWNYIAADKWAKIDFIEKF